MLSESVIIGFVGLLGALALAAVGLYLIQLWMDTRNLHLFDTAGGANLTRRDAA